MRFTLKTLLMIIFCSQCIAGQQSKSDTSSFSEYFKFEDKPLVSCLFTYFPPLFIQHGIDLKDFIRSGTFKSLRLKLGDLRAVDAIYVRAMQMTNNNTAIALLMTTIAVFDHRLVGFKVPIVQLFFPLTNESSEQFQQRVNNLPARLYTDTPEAWSGDRDKLQHFFGSAFLTVVFESRDVANRFGNSIEEGERAFIVDGAYDDRDVRANKQGQYFGDSLLRDNHRLPSEFLKLWTPKERLTLNEELPCSGVW